MFAERLNHLITENDTNRNIISKATGISSGLLTEYVQGKKTPSDNIVRLAKYFDVSPDYLLKGDCPTSNTINRDVSGVGVAGSNYGSVVQGVNNGTVTTNSGHQQSISDEAAELLRIYNNLDIKRRMKLLEMAFSLEDKQ